MPVCALRRGPAFPLVSLAVAEGFEPSEAFTSHAFEACSLGRSERPRRRGYRAGRGQGQSFRLPSECAVGPVLQSCHGRHPAVRTRRRLRGRTPDGNPAALVADADDLGDGQLRALAREFNQSETAFLLQPSQSDATLRIRAFTAAGSEVGGAGHFVLAAWLWLDAADTVPRDGSPLVQELGGDRLPVEVTRTPGQSTLVTIDQSPAEFGDLVEDTTRLIRALGLAAGDLTGEPVQVVSTGVGHLLVPAIDRAAVDRARPDAPALEAVLRATGGEGCYLYSRDPHDPTAGAVAYARFFNPTVGLWEDPATGTAAGPLTASLVARGLVPPDTPVVIEQGYAMGRPSRLRVAASAERVRLSGCGVVVAEGTVRV